MQELNEYSYNSHFLNTFSEKVEARIKDLHYNRQTIIGINSIEEFIISKIKLSQFYFDIEDDLREMLQKYKSLFINCKELQEKNHLLANTIRSFETKNLNLEKIQSEFKQNINDLVSQIGFLREKQINNEDYISYLEEKVRLMERNLGRRNNNLIGDFARRERSRENLNSGRRVSRDNLNGMGLNDLSYAGAGNVRNNDKINSNDRIDCAYGIKNNNNNSIYSNEINDVDRNSGYYRNVRGEVNEFSNRDKDRNSAKNQGDFVEKFLSNYKNKVTIDAEKSPINSVNTGKFLNLNYDNYYNNTAEENRSEANVNYLNNNKINFETAGENSENSRKPISKTIDYEENDKNNKRYKNLVSEREKSKQLLNEYLKNTLNVSSIEAKKPDINVVDHIDSIIVNRNQENEKTQGQSNYKKINPNNKNQANSIQVNENDIREYAMDIPVKRSEADEETNVEINNNNNNQYNNNLDDLIIETKNPQKKKSDRIIDLLMKIKGCSDTSSILTQIYGESLIDKIISPDCDENFLAELEKTVSEIDSVKQKNLIPNSNRNKKESLNKKHDANINNNNNKNKHNQIYQFDKETENLAGADYAPDTDPKSEDYLAAGKIPPQTSQRNQRNPTHTRQYSNIDASRSDLENLIQRNYSTKNFNTQPSREGIRRSHSKSTLNVSRNSKSRGSKGKVDFFEESVGSEPKFEQMLRKYGGKQMSGKGFMNYFRKVGDFFDPTLQKGGNSTLDFQDQSRIRSGSRRRSRGNTNNNSVSISYSQQHNN